MKKLINFSDGSLVTRVTSNKFRYMLEQPYSLKLPQNIISSCRKSLKLVDQQETVFNFENTTGSSETTRETSIFYFQFSNFRNLLPEHKTNTQISDAFLQWFIGFVEGDGSFIVSKDKDRLFFIINQKDIKTLFNIRTTLGFGKVSWYKTYGRYIVTDKDNLYRLITIFNGHLLLNKTNIRFASWVVAFNNKYNYDIILLNKLIPTTHLLKNTSWLSGFISAEGCFNAVIQKNNSYSLKYRFRSKFLLDQKDENDLLTLVKDMFVTGRLEVRKDGRNVRFIIDSLIGLDQIINYLNKHPMYHTAKLIAYKKWQRFSMHIRSLNLNKNKIDLEKIIKLGHSINEMS